MMKQIILMIALTFLCACGNAGSQVPEPVPVPSEKEETPMIEPAETASLRMFVNNEEIAVQWEDNDTVRELTDLAKDHEIVIQMSMYGGWEQVGPLGTSLSSQNSRITTQPGDIVLYSGNQIVVFYGPNTWEYTMLGHMENMTEDELTNLLGNSDITLTICYK